jgi:hypothetical protein
MERAATRARRSVHLAGYPIREDGIQDVAAFALYEQGCSGDHAWGCARLGRAYDDGIGVPEDDARAVGLFRRACDLQDEDGCQALGAMLEIGEGTSSDLDAAVQAYIKSCNLGSARGCFHASRILLDQDNETSSEERTQGVTLAMHACDQGHADACNIAGYALDHGQGGKTDAPARARRTNEMQRWQRDWLFQLD